MSVCRVGACTTRVATLGHLLCPEHWMRVPTGTREAYYRAKWKARNGEDGQLTEAEQAVLTAVETGG